MNLASFIAWRIASNRKQSFSGFIIRLAIIATAVSVTAMLLTFGFTSGFQKVISNKVFSFWGHIRVQHFEPNKVSIAEELPIAKNDTIVQLIKQNKEVIDVEPFGTKNSILKTDIAIEGVLFKGVERNYNFSRINSFLKSGHWMNFPDSGYSDEIVLSEYTAGQLKLKVNDRLLVYFIQAGGAAPRPRKLKVTGLYRSGIDEYDKLIAICDLRLIQRLNDWNPNEIGGYEIVLNNYKKMDTVNDAIFYQLPQGWTARTIKEIYPNIFDWLNLQNQTIVTVIVIMIIVAILNLITCLIILVLDRTPMIGVLKALGATDFSIQKIFLYHGGIIIITGLLIGDLLAIVFSWLQQRYGFITLPEESYYISTAVVNLQWWHVVAVDSGTFIICFLCLLIPTIVVKKVEPVRAITFG